MVMCGPDPHIHRSAFKSDRLPRQARQPPFLRRTVASGDFPPGV